MDKVLRSVIVLGWLSIASLAGEPVHPSSPADRPTGISSDRVTEISTRLAESEYDIRPAQSASDTDSPVWHAPNRKQNLRIRFGPQGIRLTPRTGIPPAWELNLTLSTYAGPGIKTSLTPRTPTPTGPCITYRHPGMTVRYSNSPRGLEQDIVLIAPPGEPSDTPEWLELEWTVRSNLVAVSPNGGHTLEWSLPGDRPMLQFTITESVDGRGESVPADLSLTANGVRLRTGSPATVYPLRIKALLETPAWMGESNQAGAYFGISVSCAGDVNGDGYDDVIVGAETYDNGEVNEGRVFVYHGSSNGLSSMPNWTAESNHAGAYFGHAVACAGDVNNDGYDDVIIGAYLYSGALGNEGRAYLYLGTASGLSSNPAWTAQLGVAEARFGMAVNTAGDVNGDGYDDVVIGAPYFTNGETNEGRTYVYHGNPNGLNSSPSWWSESNRAYSLMGFSVSTAGDTNGDGYDDIVFSAPNWANGETNEGRIWVARGSPGGLGSATWAIEPNLTYAAFGYSVSCAGDVNHDGYDDIIVGEPGYYRTHAFYGSAYGLGSAPNWTYISSSAGSMFGTAVNRAGDVNGDGYDDVIIGARFYDYQCQDDGRAFVFHGSGSGLQSTPAWQVSSDQCGSYYGNAVSTAGDVNHDGYDDVIVGAFTYTNGQDNEGRVFVYHGAPDTTPPAITLSPGTLTPSCMEGEYAASQVFTVRNSGGGTLSYTISDDADWLACSPASGTSSGETDTINVYYYTNFMGAGVYDAYITVSDPAAGNNPQSIYVYLTVTTPPPLIELSTDSLVTGAQSGQNPPNQSFTVRNAGGGTLSWSVSDNASWLSCTPTYGTSSGEAATITVSDYYAGNSPQTIDVSLTVYEPLPRIELSLASLAAVCVQGSNAASQTFTVRNSGTGSLDYQIYSDSQWFSCVPAAGTSTGEVDIITVIYSTSGLAPGSYQGQITVHDPYATNTPQFIAVYLTVQAALPTISLSTTSLAPSCTQGQNAAAQSFTVRNSGYGTLNYTVGDNVAWLACSPAGGTSTGEADTITVTYTTSAMAAGTHNAVITVFDPDATNTPQTIAVTLTIEATQPTISLSTGTLSTNCTQGENAPAQSFTVRNSGSGTLNYTISDNAGWLSCSPASGSSTGEADSITVTYASSGLTAGTYTAVITISDPAATNSPRIIGVTLIVGAPPPLIELSTHEIPLTVEAGSSPSPQTFTVRNSGGGTLHYTISDNAGWLTCSPTSGTSNGESDIITLSFSTNGLSVGGYRTTVTVADSAADNSPQVLYVVLEVTHQVLRIWYDAGQQGQVYPDSPSQIIPATWLTFQLDPDTFPDAASTDPVLLLLQLPEGARLSQTLATGDEATTAPLPSAGETVVDLAVCEYLTDRKTVRPVPVAAGKAVSGVGPHAVQLFRYVAGEDFIVLRLTESTAGWSTTTPGAFLGVTIGMGTGNWPATDASNWGAEGLHAQADTLFYMDLREYSFADHDWTLPIRFSAAGQADFNPLPVAFLPDELALFRLNGYLEGTPPATSSVGQTLTDLAVIDLDRDGVEDVASVSAATRRLYIVYGRTDGTFDRLEWRDLTYTSATIVAGDVTGDTLPDLLISDDTGTLWIYTWHDLFACKDQPLALKMPGQPSDALLEDVDGDTLPDYIFTDLTDNLVVVLFGSGFSDQDSYPTGNGPVALVSADFDGDAHPDLAVANEEANYITVLWNDGNGTFTPSQIPWTGPSAVDLDAGDFDRDGHADLAVAVAGNRSLAVIRAGSNALFDQPVQRIFFEKTPAAVVSDNFDGLHGADALLGFSDSNRLALCTSDEAGILSWTYTIDAFGDVIVDPEHNVTLATSSVLSVAGGTGYGGVSDREGVASLIQQPMNLLVFPRSSSISFSVVNLSADEALLNLELYDDDGHPVGFGSDKVLPGNQYARYLAALLGSDADRDDRWTRLFCTQPDSHGLWMISESTSLRFLDGARIPEIRDAAPELVFPVLEQDDAGFHDTYLFLVNPHKDPATATLWLIDSSGHQLDSRTIHLAGRARWAISLNTTFSGLGDSVYARVSADRSLIGTALRANTEAVACLEGLPTADAATTLYCPHVAVGDLGAGYESTLTLVNVNDVAGTIQVSLYDDSGARLGNPLTLTLPARGRIHRSVEELFGLTQPTTGYLRITGTGGVALTGCITFGESGGGRFMSCLPLQATTANRFLMGHIANGKQGAITYFTGMALLNPGTGAVTATITAHDQMGIPQGTRTLTLTAGQRRIFLLGDLMPGLGAIFGGYITVEGADGEQLMVFELFGNMPLNFLSAVPAVPLDN